MISAFNIVLSTRSTTFHLLLSLDPDNATASILNRQGPLRSNACRVSFFASPVTRLARSAVGREIHSVQNALQTFIC